MRVMVTGAHGCIGAWVVKRLLERDVEVLAYDLEAKPVRLGLISTPSLWTRLRLETGRIEDTERLKTLVRDAGVTHIVHLAAQLMPYCQANPVAGGLINVIGTLNVFEAARDAGRPVRVVYASSSAVWGPEEHYEPRALTEADPLLPSTHYGVFKQANEGNARVFYTAHGISSVGLRPWTVYGVGRDRGMTADPTLAMKAVVLGAPFQIRVSGYMDLQYVEDVAECFLGCLFSDREGAQVFNLAGEVLRMEDLVSLLERLRPGAARLITAAGPQVPVAFRMDDSGLRGMIPDLRRTPLEAGIRRTLEIFETLRGEGRLSSDPGG